MKAIESPCKLDSLPEQCTRLSSHPGIMPALEGSGIDGDGGDGNVVRLGFDACLRCGTSLPVEADDDEDVGAGVSRKGSKKAPMAVSCRGCNRVRYCAMGCRAANAEDEFDESPDAGKEEEEPPSTPGHSPVVCALLGLCDDDDLAEEELLDELSPKGGGGGGGDGKGKGKNESGKNGNGRENKKWADGGDDARKEAARHRVRTELESYPATLLNVPHSEAPDWFVDAMTRRLRNRGERMRRGKRERDNGPRGSSDDDNHNNNEGGRGGEGSC